MGAMLRGIPLDFIEESHLAGLSNWGYVFIPFHRPGFVACLLANCIYFI